MWKDNKILTDKDLNLLFIGDIALKYLDLKRSRTIGYPENRIQKGDIIIYFTADNNNAKNICAKLSIATPNTFISNVLIIAAIYNDDVRPISIFNFEPNTLKDMHTIYERTDIIIDAKGPNIKIKANGHILSYDINKQNEVSCILRQDKMIYYTPQSDLVNTQTPPVILDIGHVDAYLDYNLLINKSAKDILMSEISASFGRLIDSGDSTHILDNEINVVVRLETMNLGDDEFNIYSFRSLDTIMSELIAKTTDYNRLSKVEYIKEIGSLQYNSFRLWGSNGKLKRLEMMLQKASITNSTILLEGESGTGKTFLAKEIHNNSKRADQPFVHINCAAVPYNLIESELFGYEEGAFTGASKGGKKGLFETAYGGTLFLDEISEIPLQLQGKLLEVLQSRTFYRVGGTHKLSVDIRLIAATNRHLKTLVKEKKFREDLYYRINVFPLEIPPLRERMESIQAIIGDILPDICDRLEIEPRIVGYNALEKIKKYEWPGNIRELENVLEKAAILCDGKMIMPENIILAEADESDIQLHTMREQKENCEKEAIKNALSLFDGDKSQAARYLDIGRTSMFDKIKKYNLDRWEDDNYDFR